MSNFNEMLIIINVELVTKSVRDETRDEFRDTWSPRIERFLWRDTCGFSSMCFHAGCRATHRSHRQPRDKLIGKIKAIF